MRFDHVCVRDSTIDLHFSYLEDIIQHIAYRPTNVRGTRQMDELRDAIQRDNVDMGEENVKTLAAVSAQTSADPLVSTELSEPDGIF